MMTGRGRSASSREGLALVGVGLVAGPAVAACHDHAGDAAPAKPPGEVAAERVDQRLEHEQRPGERLLALEQLDGAVQGGVGLVRPGGRGEQQDAVVVDTLEAAELALHVLLTPATR